MFIQIIDSFENDIPNTQGFDLHTQNMSKSIILINLALSSWSIDLLLCFTDYLKFNKLKVISVIYIDKYALLLHQIN